MLQLLDAKDLVKAEVASTPSQARTNTPCTEQNSHIGHRVQRMWELLAAHEAPDLCIHGAFMYELIGVGRGG